MTVSLTQRRDEITVGTAERSHKLPTKRHEHFTRDQLDTTIADLLTAYPDEAETLERYRVRLAGML